MPRLCLVRHTTPLIDPDRPAEEWNVGEEGRAQAESILPTLEEIGATVIVSSPELKAQITAEILAHGSGLPLRNDERLREQGLGAVPFYGGHDEFHEKVREHFAHPEIKLLGNESSRAAAHRFDLVVREFGKDELPVLVSHGRILSAWLASQVDLDAYDIWQSLLMPDALFVEMNTRMS
ncbi:MAG: histidine phosphatase family protein [Thermomicrobiales bacterium]